MIFIISAIYYIYIYIYICRFIGIMYVDLTILYYDSIMYAFNLLKASNMYVFGKKISFGMMCISSLKTLGSMLQAFLII